MYFEQSEIDYLRIEKAIRFIRENQTGQPSLDEVADHVNLSPHHFQRLFTRWAGVSPKKFLQYLTIQFAREHLSLNLSLSEISYEAGLSGSGRLHDLFMGIEGMTPEQYRKSGSGITICYGVAYSPFGKYLLAFTREDRICTLQFIEDEDSALAALRNQWSSSTLIPDQEQADRLASGLFNVDIANPVNLLLRGTPFQLKVWEALLKIPFGAVTSYQTIAEYIKNPKGLQAVGSAIGKNPVAFLIPCHRVIKKTGQISEYRWRSARKSAILAWEASPA